MEIRKSTIEDLSAILEVYSNARKFMADHGNPSQWGTNRPTVKEIENDILTGNSYVCINNNEICAVFYFAFGFDSTYKEIFEGNWLCDDDYAVVHRIASTGKVKGAGSFCLNWAFNQSGNLKIDTHRNNIIMQKTLKKNNFKYCGVIYLDDGEERLAYQRIE